MARPVVLIHIDHVEANKILFDLFSSQGLVDFCLLTENCITNETLAKINIFSSYGLKIHALLTTSEIDELESTKVPCHYYPKKQLAIFFKNFPISVSSLLFIDTNDKFIPLLREYLHCISFIRVDNETLELQKYEELIKNYLDNDIIITIIREIDFHIQELSSGWKTFFSAAPGTKLEALSLLKVNLLTLDLTVITVAEVIKAWLNFPIIGESSSGELLTAKQVISKTAIFEINTNDFIEYLINRYGNVQLGSLLMEKRGLLSIIMPYMDPITLEARFSLVNRTTYRLSRMTHNFWQAKTQVYSVLPEPLQPNNWRQQFWQEEKKAHSHLCPREHKIILLVKDSDIEGLKGMSLSISDLLNIKDSDKNSILDWAICKRKQTVLNLFYKVATVTYCKEYKFTGTLLHWAIYCRQDAAEISRLIASGLDVNSIDKKWKTPLCLSVEKSYEEGLLSLITNGIGLTQGTKNAALSLAVKSGQSQFLELLINAGASVETKYRGNSVLYIASEQGYSEVVGCLLQYGANCNVRGSMEKTALYIAAKLGHLSVIRLLLAAKASFDTIHSGYSPFHTAIFWGHYSIVEILINYGAPLNAPATNGATPLHIAAHKGHCSIVKLLLEKGADKASLFNGYSLLHTAVEAGHLEVVKELVPHYKESINQIAKEQRPIDIAVKKNYLEIIKELVRYGAHFNKSEHVFVPLSHAAQCGQANTVAYLLNLPGIIIDELMSTGETPLDLAIKGNKKTVVKLLLAYGANYLGRSLDKFISVEEIVDLQAIKAFWHNPATRSKDKKRALDFLKSLIYDYGDIRQRLIDARFNLGISVNRSSPIPIVQPPQEEEPDVVKTVHSKRRICLI